MSDVKAHWSVKPFVSHDGGDAKGVRAEVLVFKGVGKIESIVSKGVTANVIFKVDGLKHPISGWLNSNDPIFPSVEEYKDKEIDVEFRIEQQRKGTIDRNVPIEELRTSQDEANKNLTKILAGVRPIGVNQNETGLPSNMIFSDEAVTNPAEDPQGTGNERHSALNAPVSPVSSHSASPATGVKTASLDDLVNAVESGLPVDVVNVMAGQMLAMGVASPEDITKALVGRSRLVNNDPREVTSSSHFAREEAGWKNYNTDGRMNVGSGVVSASFGAEIFARKHLTTVMDSVTEVHVNWFTRRLLAIADKFQVASYGPGFPVDRSNNSHTRIRGLLYDLVDNYIKFDHEDVEGWTHAVEKAMLSRLRIILPSAANYLNYNNLDFDLVRPEDMYMPGEIVKPEELASDETVAALKQMCIDLEVPNVNHISTLFFFTFGTQKAAAVPDSALNEFIDYYLNHEDPATLNRVTEWVVQYSESVRG